jgi:hypothetical protein
MSAVKDLLMSFCQWCSASSFGHGVRDSRWLFPFIEIFHLVALGILGGTVMLINLRLLGLQFQGERVSGLARDVYPWMVRSLAVMLVSGFFLFSSEAVKMYGNHAFQTKMVSLILALLFTFTIFRKVTLDDEARYSPAWRKLTAVVSILLWAGVGLAGRAIGYVA